MYPRSSCRHRRPKRQRDWPITKKEIDKKASAAGLMRGGLLTSSSGRKMESAFPKGGGQMPIVRIDLIEGKSEEYRAQVGEIVYRPWWMFLTFPRVIAFK